jgi:SAM-dependent methyltransferase
VRAQDTFPEFVEDQRAFFDRLITDDWDTYVSPEWDAVRRKEVRTILDHTDAKRVLDIGCGCGFHDVEFASAPGVVEVVGIDYSEKSVETAEREYPHPRVRRTVADAFTFRDEPFDLVVSFQVIEHLTDPRAFLETCAKNAAIGGTVAVVTPNRLRLDNRWQTLRRRPALLIDPQHYREYAPSELRDIAAGLPLAHVATVGLSAQFVLPRLGRNIVPARAGRRLARLAPSLSSSYAQFWRRA